MKVLFNCHVPFNLAHGGAQIQIEQTMAALGNVDVQAEPLRWWDDSQSGNILHHFGRIPTLLVKMAHDKGLKVVISELLTEQGSRSPGHLRLQRLIKRTIDNFAPAGFKAAFNWDSYRLADAIVTLTPWEKHLMSYLFDAPAENISVVGNGVEDVFFNGKPTARNQWLVCTATITERKRVLEVAQAAVQAKTPTWIIGKAYSEADTYAQQVFALARQNPHFVRYEGPVQDRPEMARIYRSARGFVLLSTMESLSLSALEASACECPLLLSDLPWARSTFGDNAGYCPITKSVTKTASALRAFYDAAPALPRPLKPPSWIEIANQLKAIYENVLKS